MRLVRFLLARSRHTLFMAVGFGLLTGALNSTLLALVNVAIWRQRTDHRWLLLAFISLCLVTPIVRVASELLIVKLGQRSVFALRTELCRQVLAVPLRALENVGFHRILSVLTEDVPAITNVVVLIPLLCVNAGVVGSCIVYMGFLNWKLLVTVLALMVAGILGYQLTVARAVKHFVRARGEDNRLQKHFYGLIHGIKELKLNRTRRESYVSQVITTTAQASCAANISGMTLYTIAASCGQLLVFAALGLVVFYFAGLTSAQGAVLSGFAFAMLYLMAPLQVIMNSVPQLTRAGVAIGNVTEVGLKLSHSSLSTENSVTACTPATSVRLDLDNVTYSYHTDTSTDAFTLGPIHLTVLPGEILFITGGNGSGKTTLAKLMVGLYTPEAGNVFYNGEQVTEENRDNFRQCFATVFSDFFLFESLLGVSASHANERAREYLTRLRLDHKVRVENGIFSTTELSQGQRKRLALLVCCLEDRPVFLFDEWAADQDPTFREVFYFILLPELKARGKTIVVISHDDRYFSVADRVVHMEFGHLTGELQETVAPPTSIYVQ